MRIFPLARIAAAGLCAGLGAAPIPALAGWRPAHEEPELRSAAVLGLDAASPPAPSIHGAPTGRAAVERNEPSPASPSTGPSRGRETGGVSSMPTAGVSSMPTAAPAPAESSRPGIQEVSLPFEQHTLPNGLRVLTLEDHSVPSVTYWTWFRVGSIDERPGITGISHLFEHLMFRGAKKYGPGEFDKALESNGGYSNAFTDKDMTAYYEDLISDKVDLAVDLDSDRMASLNVTRAVLDPEREVVKEERRLRSENDVHGALDEILDGGAYLAHPYHWPVVGWMGDLNNITVEDCHDYFRTFYAPNNATVIVVGDFRTGDLLRTIERLYAAIPAQPPPRAIADSEPQQKGERRLVYYKEAQIETLAAAWHAPRVDGDLFYAMELLQNVLGQGRSSRLYRRLVYEAQAAVNVSAANEWRRQPGLFKIYLDMKPGHPAAEGETLMNEELARLRSEDVSDSELQKAKNNVRASFIRQMKTNNGKGLVAGQFEILWGDWSKYREFLPRIEAVSKADLRAAANRYLTDLNKTVVTLVPHEPSAKEVSPKSDEGSGGDRPPARRGSGAGRLESGRGRARISGQVLESLAGTAGEAGDLDGGRAVSAPSGRVR